MDDIRRKALSIYKRIEDAHHQAFVELLDLKKELAGALDLAATVDTVALMKKADDLLGSAKHEVSESITALSKVAVVLYLREGKLGSTVKTDWVVGLPGTKTVPRLPKFDKNPEAFGKLAAHFGVSPEAYGTFRPHWPAMKELITECEANGTPYPPGIDKNSVLTEYTVRCTWNKDVSPEGLSLA